jgi:Cu(I)/Ag(I) efflux system membrane protein CusA/SilA
LLYGALIILGVIVSFTLFWWLGVIIILISGYQLLDRWIPKNIRGQITWGANLFVVLAVAILLAEHWTPLGPEKGLILNFIFTVLLIGGLLALFYLFMYWYVPLLNWCLEHKTAFLSIPFIITFLGLMVWIGFDAFFGWLPASVKRAGPVSAVAHTFPGLGKEFMPPLDEGSYLFMPTTMPHASIGEALDVLQKQDMAMHTIPEVDTVVGKIGRVESSLDPAPISMIETVINYKPEYLVDSSGNRLRFRYDSDEDDFVRSEDGTPLLAPDGEPYKVSGSFIRDDDGNLIPDEDGRPFRLWRPPLDTDLNEGRDAWEGIKKPDDIWNTIVKVTALPGTTSAPRLQPIAARIVMLQSGMRAPLGVKIKGPDLETIEQVGLQIERLLKEVPSIEPAAVVADRIVGKPYLEIDIDRKAIARYGIRVNQVQDVIEVAVGGKRITTTVEGRERYPVRVRYMRELRDSIEALTKILVPAPDGTQIPIMQLAEINYVRGPQVIKSEDTFLIGYVIFDKKPGFAEVDVVEQAQDFLDAKIASGELDLPAGVSFTFAGSYENQVRAQKRLIIILPLALFIIFIIIYFQFKSTLTTVMIFSGIGVCWAGGFILLWFYGQPWFLDFSVFGVDLRELFQIHPVNLSVAVWVGFLALFGIATDNGVIMATYLDQTFSRKPPLSVADIRKATIKSGERRVRPCLMTTATTILALIPVLTSTGRGSDVMVPMAIPSFGGMVVNILTLFLVPVLYAAIQEIKLKSSGRKNR